MLRVNFTKAVWLRVSLVLAAGRQGKYTHFLVPYFSELYFTLCSSIRYFFQKLSLITYYAFPLPFKSHINTVHPSVSASKTVSSTKSCLTFPARNKPSQVVRLCTGFIFPLFVAPFSCWLLGHIPRRAFSSPVPQLPSLFWAFCNK